MTEQTELGDVLLDALCDSPIWHGRHVGDLELHLVDEIAGKVLAAGWRREVTGAVAEA